MLVSWNWIKEYIGDTTLTATEAAELLGRHAFELEGVTEHADDTVIDVDILPNRSSDCLSHRGIARELASITGTPLAHDPLTDQVTYAENKSIQINIEDSSACPRFSAALIRGVTIKESPAWLQDRLRIIGQRPINNIVDATNYVMFALGQPLHAYDAELFPQTDGVWQFGVRYAKAGEEVHLIPEAGQSTERVVTCTGTELLIVDESQDVPIGLAGVKGGRYAGVHAGTTNIIIEAAHFDPILTRKTARRLGIVIDASKRFENEPSRELVPYAQQAIIKLVLEIAGGSAAGVADQYLVPQTKHPVQVDPKRVNAHLGLNVSTTDMTAILQRIGATVEETENALTVTAPWERTDLQIEEDYIEEIGRLYGYDQVVALPPQPLQLAEINSRHYYSEQIRACLLEQGFSEVITSSFRKKDKVELKNALASDKRFLRSNLQKGLITVLDTNAHFKDLLGTEDTRVFEIGTVFKRSQSGVEEHVSLALGVRVKVSGYSGKEDKFLEAAQKAVAKELETEIEWTVEKGVTETNLTEIISRLPLPDAYQPVTPAPEIEYQPFSTYPAITRDIAMWVEEDTAVETVEALLRAHAGLLCKRITHIDSFAKDGRQSLAFRLVFQSMDKTLTDAEVNADMEAVYTAVADCGWEVR